MADVTYAVKVDEALKEKINELVQGSGLTAKEFFASLIANYEKDLMKTTSPGFKKEIEELELHTSRINEIFVNAIKRTDFEKEELRRGFDEELDKKNKVILDFNAENNDLKAKNESLLAQIKELEEKNDYLVNQINSVNQVNQRNEALIKQYTEKIDTLSGLVNEYKGYKNEIEEVKKQLYVVETKNKDLMAQNKALQDQIERIKKEHQDELALVKERLELEKEKDILAVKKEYEEKLQAVYRDYNENLKNLYEEINRKRDEISLLKEKIEKGIRG